MSVDKTPAKIHTMFNLIADNYDFINNIISFGTQHFIKSKCIKALKIKQSDYLLDLCTGTGDLARLAQKEGANVVAVDFSEKMLEIAKDKSSGISYLQRDVTNLPFPNESFDIVTIGFGLRNVCNPEKAVEEVYRILKSGGKFLHLDFGKKNLASKIYDKTTGILTKIFSRNSFAYSYLIKSKQEFLSPKDLITDFESKGFKLYKRKDYALGVVSCQILVK